MSVSNQDFDFSVDILNALIWRDNQAVNLQSLLNGKAAWYEQNHEDFWSDWLTNVFNLDTANEFGLAVWAQILGLPLTLIVAPNPGPQFGFGPKELLSDAADAHGTWTQTGGAVITAGQTDPNSGTYGVKVDLSAGGTKKVSMVPVGTIPAGRVTLTFQAKLVSGTQGTIASDINGTTLGNWPALTSAWQTVTLTGTLGASQTTFNLISSTASTAVVEVFNPLLSAGVQTTNGRLNFNNGNFGAAQSGVGLTLDQKRLLLKLQYFKLTTRCTVPEVNARLKALLGKYGSVYILDGNNMQYTTYVFGFVPNSALQFVLENFDVLPRPAAVGVKYIVSTRPSFGFGSSNQNFNNGTFWAEN